MKHKSQILSRISGLLLFTFFISYISFSQRVAINTDGSAPDTSAMLDIKSTTAGVLIPRLTTDQRVGITGPAAGLVLYDTETKSFWFYTGSAWMEVLSGFVRALSDEDQDTKVEVEKTTDDDLIHFTMEGTEYFRMDSGRLEVLNTDGSILIGEDAGLHDDLSGGGNVAIGSAALKHNSDRSGHVAIGDSALYYNGSGPGVTEDYHATKNTAIGDHSLFNNTSGDDNTAVGFLSLYSNESGYRNSAFGKEALYSNDSARYNNAFGNRALYSNTGGSFNIAVGASAMYSNTTGNHNTAVGNRPLNNNIVGSDNVAIGAEAGFMSDGSGNIFLGYRAGYNELGDNRLYVHNDSASSPLIYGEFDNNMVKVNGKLDVGGEVIIDDSNTPSPVAGTIRWNTGIEDFEGYTGEKWVSLTSQPTWGQLPNAFQNATVASSDGNAMDEFGWSVSIFEEYAVVGAPKHNTGGSIDQGQAYVFHKTSSGWSELAILDAWDGSSGDQFGQSVAITEDYVYVGAPHYNTGKGKVYIFIRSGLSWSIWYTLFASDGAANDFFGQSIAVTEDYAIIGAHRHDTQGNGDQGKAYIFTYHQVDSSWTEQDILISSDGATGDRFGESVAISGDYAIVGSRWHDVSGNSAQGKAYIFHRTGTEWNEQDSLVASDGAAGDFFGESVGISGDYAIVGAHRHTVGSNSLQGKVYIFHRTGMVWSEQDTLVASDGTVFDHFGESVAISGDHAIIAAKLHDSEGNFDQGKVYIFRRSGEDWIEQDILIASDGAAEDWFGASVDITGEIAIIGAQRHDTPGNDNQGKAYIFQK